MRRKKTLPYNRAFYKKHGIKITGDAIPYNRTATEENIVAAMHGLALRKNPAIAQLEKAVADYPHIPELKNYLEIGYKLKGDEENAKRVMLIIRQMHPDYFFGIMSEVEFLIREGNLEKADELLKNPRSINSFYPDIVHISAFSMYISNCIDYDLAKEDLDAAIEKFGLLYENDPSYKSVKTIGTRIMFRQLELNLAKRKIQSLKYVHVESQKKDLL